MINNKTLFESYLILRLLIFITLIIIGGIIITTSLIKTDFFQLLFSHVGKNTFIALNWVLIFFLIIDERIKPAFIEFHPIEDKIIIKTYSPHFNRWESPFILVGYKKRMKELKISREEYNDYKLTIGKFGLRKELKLQKINSSGVYESSTINISLLGSRKYTNLILAIDRLRTKISLN